VRDFKQRYNLGSSSEVDQYTWRALEAAVASSAAHDPPST
jgi:hypothetical protein